MCGANISFLLLSQSILFFVTMSVVIRGSSGEIGSSSSLERFRGHACGWYLVTLELEDRLERPQNLLEHT